MSIYDYDYFGFKVFNSRTREPATIGVIVNGMKMLDGVYGTARRIADAGPSGLSVDAVSRSDVAILRSAGVKITGDAFGTVWHLDEVPAPSHYIVEAPKPETSGKRWGQFGSSGIPKQH